MNFSFYYYISAFDSALLSKLSNTSQSHPATQLKLTHLLINKRVGQLQLGRNTALQSMDGVNHSCCAKGASVTFLL
jgi:hypothetical protein